jgi:hypothetical protein
MKIARLCASCGSPQSASQCPGWSSYGGRGRGSSIWARSCQVATLCMLRALCRSEDDLTHQLGEIIKANIRLKKQDESGAPQHIISEFALLLQVGRLHLFVHGFGFVWTLLALCDGFCLLDLSWAGRVGTKGMAGVEVKGKRVMPALQSVSMPVSCRD